MGKEERMDAHTQEKVCYGGAILQRASGMIHEWDIGVLHFTGLLGS